MIAVVVVVEVGQHDEVDVVRSEADASELCDQQRATVGAE